MHGSWLWEAATHASVTVVASERTDVAIGVLERDRMTDQSLRVGELEDAARLLGERFRGGDERALEQIYREHSRLVYSFCRRALDEHRAADATQEVFIAAWRSRERYRVELGSVAGWLMGIARFKVVDMLRVEQRNPLAAPTAQGVDHGAVPTDVESMAQRMLIADALLELPERSREIVRSAYFDDRTHTQIAEVSGIPLGTVKSDIRRGLQRLRRHLEAFDDAPRS